MLPLAPERSRDRRIEDPSNLWIIHPAARSLLPWFLARGISANAVSLGGLFLGALAALAFAQWRLWPFAWIGLLLSIAWLIADGLDGMIARATRTASPLGRILDGICDHGVFLLIYVALAASIGTPEAWMLAAAAAAFHAVQSNIYESERARFHRRSMGAAAAVPAPARNLFVRLYDYVFRLPDRLALPFDRALGRGPNQVQLGAAYGASAAKPLLLMSLLSANVRVYAIFLACIVRHPALFWWFELPPLTAILIIGFCWHRAVEARLIGNIALATAPFPDSSSIRSKDATN